MSRLPALSPELVSGGAKELLEGVGRKLGMVPNMMRTMANSSAALDGYLQLNSALARGVLSAKVREQIALAVAEANGCNYCLAAHSAIGRMVGLSADQIRDSRQGSAVDPKTEVLIQFARKVVEARGQVSAADVNDVRAAGFDDGVVAEVVASVALHIFTNYFNLVADTEVDFPHAPALRPEAA